jgi:hypothetical protein
MMPIAGMRLRSPRVSNCLRDFRDAFERQSISDKFGHGNCVTLRDSLGLHRNDPIGKERLINRSGSLRELNWIKVEADRSNVRGPCLRVNI